MSFDLVKSVSCVRLSLYRELSRVSAFLEEGCYRALAKIKRFVRQVKEREVRNRGSLKREKLSESKLFKTVIVSNWLP